jgi:hypothetical protein
MGPGVRIIVGIALDLFPVPFLLAVFFFGLHVEAFGSAKRFGRGGRATQNRNRFSLTANDGRRSFRSRSEALTKAFSLTPRDTEVPGA